MNDRHASGHDFETGATPTWCPGCGNFALWTALNHVFAAKGWRPHDVVVVFDIGCSGNGSNWIKAYSFHGLHGRSLPLATGVALANHGLKTVVISGDGAAYGEGLGHFLHALRGNPNLTYIVEDNQLYALTKGQASPTSAEGTTGESTPFGSPEAPLNPIRLALAANGTFVARGFAGDLPHLESIIHQALDHRGFAFIDVFQPCVTFNKVNTFGWFYDRVKKLDTMNHNPSDPAAAAVQAAQTEAYLPIGVFYRATRPVLADHYPQLSGRPLARQRATPADIRKLMRSLS